MMIGRQWSNCPSFAVRWLFGVVSIALVVLGATVSAAVEIGTTRQDTNTPILFRAAVRTAKESMDEAARLASENAGRIKGLKSRFEVLAEEAEIPLSIGNATPGLTRGPLLTKTELGQLASGASLAADTDV